MDTRQPITPVNNLSHLLPAQLFVGAPSTVIAHVIAYVQQQLCIQQGCGTCTLCTHIASRRHYATTWIAPLERYTLEDLTPLLQTVSLKLDENQHHYIIIEQVDTLPPLCANVLLKTIEEPPPGYHIILLANTLDRILVTIRSRCLITHIGGTQYDIEHPLMKSFLHNTLPEPNTFLKLIEQSKLTEQESFTLLDILLAKLLTTLREHYALNQEPPGLLKHRYSLLKYMCSRALMPGSSKIIWRELYLQWNTSS